MNLTPPANHSRLMKTNPAPITMQNHPLQTARQLALPRPLWPAVLGLALLLLLASGPPGRAQIPNANPPDQMSYQGFLVDANGTALGNASPANYDVVFRIYNAGIGGTQLWGEQQTVTVDKGYFSIRLGQGAQVGPRPALNTVFLGSDASDRYIGVTVKGLAGGDVEILPRQRLLPGPYAYAARNALALNAMDSSFLNGRPIYLRSQGDPETGFNALNYDSNAGGPNLQGKTGGYLVGNGQVTLRWTENRVGINNTANPQEALDVNGNVKAAQFIGDGSRLTGISITADVLDNKPLWLRGRDNYDGVLGYDAAAGGPNLQGKAGGFLVGNGKITLRWTENRVGINNPAPSEALDVNGNVRAVQFIGAVNSTGPVQLNKNPILFGDGADPNHRIVFNPGIDGLDVVGFAGGNLASMRNGGRAVLSWREINNSGRVGINTETPRAPLDVRGLVSNEFFLGNIRYFNPSTANPVFFANADAFELSIIAEGRIAARQFDAYSDRRI